MDYPPTSRDMEYGGSCSAVDTGGEQWKMDYPPTSRDMEHGGFYSAVDAGGE